VIDPWPEEYSSVRPHVRCAAWIPNGFYNNGRRQYISTTEIPREPLIVVYYVIPAKAGIH
jgi:hypothetical protein